MTDLVLDGGTLLASLDDDRSVEGLLVPFGEEGRSNLGRFRVSSGAFSIPADVPNTVGMNVDHVREQVIGRAAVLRETAQGVVGRFSFARTPEGDAALEDFRTGRRRHLSAEVADVVIRGGRAVSGRIFGAALVAAPAFPSATLLAAAADTPDPAAPVDEQLPDGEVAVPEEASGDVTETTKTERLPDGRLKVTRTTVTVTTETPDAANADGTTEGDTVTNPAAPSALLERFTGNTGAAPRPPQSSRTLLASLIEVGRTGDATLLAQLHDELTPEVVAQALAQATKTRDATLLAALTDVKISGAGDALPPQWLGKLWQSKAYVRRVVPLLEHGTLTSMKLLGWRWKTRPVMAAWGGDKTAVPSGPVETETAPETAAKRWAGAHDVGREFRDFDVPEFWTGYFDAMTESYARLTDADTLATLLSSAPAVTQGTIPTGIATAAAQIVDGALAILEDATPTFALVAPGLWRELVLTPKDKVLEFLTSAVGLEEGSLAGFRILPHASIPTGRTLVGARNAATVHELGETPLRTEGLDMVRGGIDPGLFGYSATVVHSEDALALVGPSAG